MRETPLPSVLRFLVPVAVAACAGDDATTDPASFVEFWVDSDAWCQHSDECGIASLNECKESWDTADAVRRAIERASLDSDDLTRCEEAARASERCYLRATCDDLNSDVNPCREPEDEVGYACAALLRALQMQYSEG